MLYPCLLDKATLKIWAL